MPEIVLPNNWRPRPYQMAAWKYLENGGRHAELIWHRRSGKDEISLHRTAIAAHERIAGYWHMLPEAAQARKAIWEAINPHTGERRIDEAFPPAIRETTREQEMFIKFKCGSTWQVVGSDNFNSLIGSPPVGIVYSEWALANPMARAMLRPIILENKGWQIFITTPRGKNHAYRTFKAAEKNESAFAQKLTVHDTGTLSPEDLEVERQAYIDDFDEDQGTALFEQEYLCSFDAAILGAYYGKLLQTAEKEGRICNVPYEPGLPVHTAWDLGIGDSTAIWFVQQHAMECRVIDFYEASGAGLDHYAKVLREKPYAYGEHILPHDVMVSDLSTGRTRYQTLAGLGISARVLGREGVDDGIQAARRLIPQCWFDEKKCEHGLDALRQYRREYDDKLKTFRDRPLHDWTSHAADAFRYLARGLPDQSYNRQERQRYSGRSRQHESSWASAW